MTYTVEPTDLRVDPDLLEQFAQNVLEAAGTDPKIAIQVSKSLVLADLSGHNSHGITQLSRYIDRFKDPSSGAASNPNMIDPTAEPVVEKDEELYALVDGASAFGQVVGRTAVDLLTDRAAESGIGMVGIRDGNHLGRIGEWAERTTSRGLFFMAFVKGEGELVVPAGSSQRRLSTNPLCFGVPTFDALEFPIVLDMATSMVAGGKIRELHEGGELIPPGWTVTESGDPVTEPADFLTGEGGLLPLGGRDAGYKGTGLSLMVELFGSILGDGVIAGEREHVGGNNTAIFIAGDPLLFTTTERIEERIELLREYLDSTEYSPDVPAGAVTMDDVTLLPGESEFLTVSERRAEGIPISAGTLEKLVDLSNEYDEPNVDGFPREL